MRSWNKLWKGGVASALVGMSLAGAVFANEAVTVDVDVDADAGAYADVYSDSYSESLAPQYSYDTVVLGSTGDTALYVQQLLYIIGFPVEMDGYFGGPSEEYLKQFQSMAGLYPDGVAGAITIAALEEAAFGGAITSISETGSAATSESTSSSAATLRTSAEATSEASASSASAAASSAASASAATSESANLAADLTAASADTSSAATTESIPTLAAVIPDTYLSIGDSNEYVVALQQQLMALGYLNISAPDGIFGNLTDSAVKSFQSANGIYPDGVVGPVTNAALYGGSAPAPEPAATTTPEAAPAPASTPTAVIPTTMLVIGDRNDQVVALQQRLMELGYLNISAPDGIFGNLTDSAVKAFQSANGIYPDGAVGPVTSAALYGDSAPAATPAPAPTPATTGVGLDPNGMMVLGDSSDQVTALQQRLIDLKYLNITAPDGTFGQMTENAVKAFQAANGIYADGAVGPVTLSALLGSPAEANWNEVQSASVSVLNQVGWDLHSAFEYAAGLNYNFNLDLGYQTSQAAISSINTRNSNCVGMAATFAWLARQLGYNAYVVSGQVPYRSGGYGEHAWVEIVVDGKTYVCDPQFENETKNNGFMINYGDSGTWVYVYGSILGD